MRPLTHGDQHTEAGHTGVVSGVFTPQLKTGDLRNVVGWWNILTANGAGLLADPGEQHAQKGEDFRDGAHRGSWTVIGQVLVDADCGG